MRFLSFIDLPPLATEFDSLNVALHANYNEESLEKKIAMLIPLDVRIMSKNILTLGKAAMKEN